MGTEHGGRKTEDGGRKTPPRLPAWFHFSSLLGMLEGLFTPENIAALATLTLLEVVLGIDNVIFISILANKLPQPQRALGRRLGIGLAVGSRLVLLLFINWITGLTAPLITVLGKGISGRDLILLAGGLFLIAKSTWEIHEKLEAAEKTVGQAATASMGAVIVQIAIIDLVFSLDSVITAVGVSGVLAVMIPAILIAAVVMVVFAGTVSRFVERHPTMKVLALAFLILIGMVLVFEGWNPEMAHQYHLKNYVYFAMTFSFLVELVNLRVRRSTNPVHLHNQPHAPES